MPLLLIAVILGVVEGLTEFLPVSSTGHLILAGHLLGFTGEEADTFEIFIQLGAILAVVACYWKLFLNLASFKPSDSFGGRNGVLLLIVTTMPALVIGKLAHDPIKHYLFTPVTVAIGLAVGAVWILVTEQFFRHRDPKELDRLTWKSALGIGFFQCLAMWPGMSRSASTILGGMYCGLNRKAATEYSFFAAVPIMFAATLFDLFKSRHALHGDVLPLFAVGFIVSFIAALVAIRMFIRFVSTHTLSAFAWYRLVVAALVFALMR